MTLLAVPVVGNVTVPPLAPPTFELEPSCVFTFTPVPSTLAVTVLPAGKPSIDTAKLVTKTGKVVPLIVKSAKAPALTVVRAIATADNLNVFCKLINISDFL